MTYVYSKSEICIYVDGILTCRWGEGAIGSVLKVLNKGKFIIGAGASEEELENFGGYIDDIYIYNQALDDTAVKEIGKKKPAEETPGGQKPSVPDDTKPEEPNSPQKVFEVKGVSYEITSKNSVSYRSAKKAASKVIIPSAVKINGKSYKVTGIKAKAFKNNKKLRKVTIGKNVTKIGAQAFNNCKNLKLVIIKTKELTAKRVGSKAFKGIRAKGTIKVPKTKRKAYRILLKKKGIGKKVKVK